MNTNSATAENHSIEDRLERLERENRRLRIGFLSFVALSLGIGIVACTEEENKTSGVAKSISAKEFILIGKGPGGKDREIGRWGHTDKGSLVFDLGGSPGHPRVRLSGEEQSCGLVAWSPSGYPAAKLLADRDHGGRVLLFGKRGPNADRKDPIEDERKEAEKYEVESFSFLFASDNAHLLLEDRKDDQRIDLRTRTKELNGPILELQEPVNELKLEVGRPTKSARHRLYYWDTGSRKPVDP